MASGGSNLNTSTSAEDQNGDNRQIYETALKNFKKYKVEISDVIQDTFPFLELLRDREFISNETYADCEDCYRKHVPVQRVVYNVLCELEKTFDLPLLEVIFSDVLKKTNPGLNRICEIFRNVIPDKTFFSDNAGEKREEWPDIQPNFEQGTGENSCQILTWPCSDHWYYNGLFLFCDPLLSLVTFWYVL
nr:PREDICTED: nuclear autoantigen Sp-100-like isoform X1 [Rhinolophus sinicus]